jgi:hypothetical protein
LDEEVEVVHAQQPLSIKDLEMGKEKVDDAGTHGGSVGNGNELPFSKARCIALVATVTGAAFLNVRSHLISPFRCGLRWKSSCVGNLHLTTQTLGVQSAVIILPTIGRALSIPDSRQQWIVSAYNLTFGCFLVKAPAPQNIECTSHCSNSFFGDV